MPVNNYPEITEEDVKKYLRLLGVRCPYCGSHNISAGQFVSFDDIYGLRHVECFGCGNEWEDIYSLCGIKTSRDGYNEDSVIIPGSG